MPAVMQFNTSNQTLRQLLGNGLTYRVPPFQRDYSWDQEQWEELWQDILQISSAASADGAPSAHYLGYVVLQSTDNKQFDVIDGQQRLATLSLVFLAGIDLLEQMVRQGVEADANRQRAAALRATYIGFLDPVTLLSRNKLTLNRNDKYFFETYLAPLQPPPRGRGLAPSNRLLLQAYTWLSKQLHSHLGGATGAAVAQLLADMADRLFFTVISVADELNAFTVFETLNSRGVRLSSTDLLKNYLFSLVSRHGADDRELNQLEVQWQAILDKLGDEDFPNYLRVWWNGRHPLARQSELFKEVRKHTTERREVFELLRALDRMAAVYVALGKPESELWTRGQREALEQLKMFGVKQPFVLLLAAYERLEPDDFARLAEACAVLSFRYNVIGGLHTGEQEKVYHDLAVRISTAPDWRLHDILLDLAALSPSDDQFRSNFAQIQLRTTSPRNKRIARYICARLQHYLGGPLLDPDDGTYTLEHILPENPDPDAWPDIDPDEARQWCYRLGNYTLLESTKNQSAANRSWSEKRLIFGQSAVGLTQGVAERYVDAWGPAQIDKRQKYLAQQAVAAWRLVV